MRNLFLVFLLFLMGISPLDSTAQESLFKLNDGVPESAEEVEEEKDPVDAAIEGMDLRAQISQLMIVTAQGHQRPQSEDFKLLQDYTPGGVIITQILKQEFTAAYVAKLRGAESLNGIPMWVGANMYWLARRERDLKTSFVQLPSLLSVAAADDDEANANLSELMAQYMRGMGFNFHLGPNLTLAPKLSAASGDISNVGSDAEFAARLGATMMETFGKYAVMPVATGFPGGGANRTPQSPAILLTPPNAILGQDMLPYARMIEKGLPMILVDNVLTPTLDTANLPASLSAEVVKTWLRGKLNFNGLIVAGPIDGSDISGKYDTAEAAIMALNNGADMLFWQGQDNAVMRGIDRLVLAVERGELNRAEIAQSLRRVLALKRLQGHLPGMQPEAPDSLNLKAKKLQELTYQVERKSITLVQNNGSVLPLGKDTSAPIGITGVVGVEELHGFLEKHIKKISQQQIYTALQMGRVEEFEIDRLKGRMGGLRTVLCLLSDDVAVHGQVRLLKAIRESGAKVVAILFGYPKQLPEIAENSDAVVLLYCDEESNNSSMLALADVLVGQGPVRILETEEDSAMKTGVPRVFDVRDVIRVPAGRLPVSVAEKFPAGWSVPYEPGEAIKKVEWDFGNGKKASKDRVELAYEAPGHYTVTLTIKDAMGDQTAGTFAIEVR